MKRLLFITSILAGMSSCISNKDNVITLSERDNVVSVKNEVHEFNIDDRLFGANTKIAVLSKYLILSDCNASDTLIHIYDSKNFRHLVSTGKVGVGPNEIGRIGNVVVDEINRIFYVVDYTKYSMFAFNIDSLIEINDKYRPNLKWKVPSHGFPNDFVVLNSDSAIGQIIEPIGTNDFAMNVAILNMNNGEISNPMNLNPDIKKKRFQLSASQKNNILVEAFSTYDMLTIANLQGKIICSIKGTNDRKDKVYYTNVHIVGEYIYAVFSGKNHSEEEAFSSSLIDVFDFSGNYIKTFDVGYQISDFCYDKENNRFVFLFNDTIQFGYMPLPE